MADSAEQQENEAQPEAAELEVNELKSQLADYQQALDVQQTRAIQFQQALQALDRASELCVLPALTWKDAAPTLAMYKEREQEATERLLCFEHKLKMAKATSSCFEQAYGLVVKLPARSAAATPGKRRGN